MSKKPNSKKMGDGKDIFASPTVVELGGKEFSFSPLTLGDLADFESWALAKAREDLVENMKGLGLDSKDKVELIKDFIHSLDNQYIVQQEMASLRGSLKLISIGIKKNHPEITEAELGQLISMDEVDNLNVLVDSMIKGGTGEDEDEEGNPQKGEAKPKIS